MEILGETSQILGLEGNSGSEVPLLASAAEALKVVACLCPSSYLLPSALISLYFRYEGGGLGQNQMVKDLVWPGRLAFIIVATEDF